MANYSKEDKERRIREALNARNNRTASGDTVSAKKKEHEDKINQALKAREQRVQSSLPGTFSDIQNRYKKAVDSYNGTQAKYNAYDEVYNSQRESRIELGKLRNKISAYSRYMDKNAADELLAGLDQMEKGYDEALSMAGFTNEAEYKEAQAYKAIPDFVETSGKGWQQYLDDQQKKREENKRTFWDIWLEANGATAAPDASFVGQTIQNAAYQDKLLENAVYGPMDNWSEEQKKIYGYLYGTDRAKANAYAKAVMDRKGIADLEQTAKEHPVAASGLSVLTSVTSGEEYLKDLVKTAQDRAMGGTAQLDKNYYSQATNAIRGSVMEEVDWKIKNWDAFDFLYSTAMSGADSLAAGAVFGKAGGAVLGLSAAAQATNDALERGMDSDKAFWNGLFSGAAEAIFESFSIGNLRAMKEVAPDGIKAIIKNIGKSMLVNASEEALTEIANIAYDTLINGELANITKEEFMNGGWKEALAQVLEAGASGALMGFGFGAAGNVGGYVNGRVAQNDAYKALLTPVQGEILAKALENNPENRFANRMKARTEAGKELSGRQLYKLSQQSKETETVQQEAEQEAERPESAQEATEQEADAEGVRVGNEAEEATAAAVEAPAVESARETAETAEAPKEEAPKEEAKEPEIADDGVTRQISTGKAVTPKKIVSIENGKAVVETDGGKISSEDIAYGDGNTAILWNSPMKLQGIDVMSANGIIKAYDGSIPVAAYMTGAAQEFRNGYNNLPSGGEYAAKLGQKTREIIYDIGQKASGRAVAKAQAKATEAKRAGKQSRKEGKVVFDRKDRSFSAVQETALNTMEQLSRVLGVEFHVYESSEKDGRRVFVKDGQEVDAPNGFYEDGKIYIDLNAGNDGKGTMLFTVAHELTHFIKEWSPAKFKILANLLVKDYTAKGQSVQELIDAQIAKAKKDGRTIDEDTAFEEVVADSMEAILTDGNVVEFMATVKQQDQNLWEKIRQWFKDLAEDLRKLVEAYKGVKPDSREGRMVSQMRDVIRELEKAYAEGLAEAGENFLASENMGVDIDTATKSAAPSVLYSERTWTESDYVQERDKAAGEIAKAIGVSEQKAKDYIDSVNSIAKMIAEDRVRLDYFSSPGRSSFVGNVEYGGSFDFSTLCKKRRLLTGTFTAIQKALPNTALTADEILDIRNRMKNAGLEVSCGLCYVEGSRANMGQFAKEFLRLYKQYYPDSWQPNMADVNTPDGIEWVRINHPEVYEQYEYFWNHYGTLKEGDKNLFASQQKPKLYQLHTEYKGEILEKFRDDENVEEKNLNGGIRLQSFSDFEIVHLIDLMQIIMDMSRVGLAGQAYTKVPDFAWALGDTGLKINLSLIAKGVDENGKLIFDDVEGMPIAEAMKLRDRYSENVGTILVAFNDEQLLAALADDRVDFVIPFHRSQWKKSQYEAMGLPAKTKDYTFMQNEKFIKPQYHEYRGRMVKDKATNYMPNEYWDFSKSGKENAEYYLELCARNNKRPKFYKLLTDNGDGSYSLKADGSTDGYWKLLIDFKMYDNQGNGSPQRPVKPDFTMDKAKEMLEAYKGGHSNFPVAQGIVDSFVAEYKEKHKGAKFSARDSQGNELSEGQQEYFKDSKVRDENGNLLKVYHGTNQGDFYEFLWDKTQRADGGFYGRGHYFTASKGMAELYGKRVLAGYLNIKNPFVWDEQVSSYKGRSIDNVSARNVAVRINMAKLFPELFAEKTMEYGEYNSATGETVTKEIKWKDLEKEVVKTMSTLKPLVFSDNSVQWAYPGDWWDKNIGDRHKSMEEAERNKFVAASLAFIETHQGIARTWATDEQIAWTQDYGSEITNALIDMGYDGAMQNRDGEEIVAFESNQFKEVSNKNPTENLDIRYSARDPEAQEVNRVLEKENAKLKEDVERLKELVQLQKQVTGGTKFTKTSLEAAARQMKKDTNAKGDTKELQKLLEDVYGHIAGDKELTWDSVKEVAAPAVEWLKAHVQRDSETSGYADEEFLEQELLRSVYDSYWKVSTLYTVADRYQKKINKLKLEHSGKMTELRQEAREKLENLRQAHRAEVDRIRKAARANQEEQIRQIQEKNEASRKKAVDSRRRTEARKKIRKTIMELKKILNHGNKKRNVKQGMRDFVETAIASAEVMFLDDYPEEAMIRNGVETDVTAEENRLIDETQSLLRQRDDLFNTDRMAAEGVTDVSTGDTSDLDARTEAAAKLDRQIAKNMRQLKGVFERERNRIHEATVTGMLDNLAKAYRQLGESDDLYIRGAVDENVYQKLKSLGEDMKGDLVRDLDLEQLDKLHDAYKMVLHTIRKANNLFAEDKAKSLQQTSDDIAMELGSRNIPTGKAALIAQKAANKLGWNYEKLYYALDRIGSKTFAELINRVADSEDTVMRDAKEAHDFLLETVKKYGYNNWNVNREIDRVFKDSTGREFKLTLGQMMALYAYSRRKNAWNHIQYGGFVFGKAALTNPRPADSYKLTREQCEAITNLLTPEQKAYAEEMQEYLSEVMGAKGNEVSMKLYGIEMFKEKNYFPIHVAGQFQAKAQEAQAKKAAGFGSMSNAGFTQTQNPDAKAPFVLEAFNEVWADHVNEMARYHGAVPALEDLRRVMNRSAYLSDTESSTSIQQIMENHYGKEAVEYFDNLYREANSGAVYEKLQKLPKKLLGLFRKNSVAYSLSVLVQQPASIVRAYAMVDRKYFGFKGVGVISSGAARAIFRKKDWEKTYGEMVKYAPGVTLAKEIGGFDTASGGSIRQYLLDTGKSFRQQMNTGTVKEKAGAVMNFVDDNKVANLPNVADKIAWIEIWNACKRETVHNNPSLSTGSEEFMEKVGQRFTEVIRATQVYDSIFAKSPMLKSKNLAVQAFVSFMNEPNTTANMVESALRDFGRKQGKQGLRKLYFVLHSIIFTGVMKSIIYAMRDDDEDETFVEKYMEALTGSILGDLNPANYIPLARDAWSALKGYDVERSDMAIVADAADALVSVIKNAQTDTEDMTEAQLVAFDKKCTDASWRLAESIAAFLGIPVKNIRREINAILNTAKNAYAKSGKTTWKSVWYKIQDAALDSNPFADTPDKIEKLYRAVTSGDAQYRKRFEDTYESESELNSALRKALRTHDPRVREAAKAMNSGDNAKYRKLLKEITGEGHFSGENIEAQSRQRLRSWLYRTLRRTILRLTESLTQRSRLTRRLPMCLQMYSMKHGSTRADGRRKRCWTTLTVWILPENRRTQCTLPLAGQRASLTKLPGTK